MSKITKEILNSNVLKWSDIIEDQLMTWHKIGNKEEVDKCEILLENTYNVIMTFSQIDKCKKLITFNSKINA